MTETVATEIDNTSQSGKVHLLGRSAKKKHTKQASLLTLISLSLAIAPGKCCKLPTPTPPPAPEEFTFWASLFDKRHDGCLTLSVLSLCLYF